MINQSILGDCRDVMRQLIADGVTVQTIVTSPPYYGLRDYGTATWEGGSVDCDHQNGRNTRGGLSDFQKESKGFFGDEAVKIGQTCRKCGALRVDGQLGLEETPQKYIDNMVEVFRVAKDLLKDDGTLWINIGDSYAGNNSRASNNGRAGFGNAREKVVNRTGEGLKTKDLIGIPWMLAFALRADGWYLRQDIIWSKPNPMPESVKDRCTKAHEYVFLFSKKDKYYFDSDAIKEQSSSGDGNAPRGSLGNENDNAGRRFKSVVNETTETRNKRSVWTISTQSCTEAHFAVMPESLVEPCILAGSKVGDIVFDPFMGSGTVGKVAQNLGRKWLGAELNPEYIKIQNKRTSQLGLELVA